MGRQPLPLLPLIALAALALASSPAPAAGDGSHGSDPRLRVTVIAHGPRESAVPVNANLYDRGLGFRVQTDFPAPAHLTEHLPVAARQTLVVRLRSRATRVSVGLAGRDGGAIGRRTDARRTRVQGRVWRVRLPRTVPRRADRLSIGVSYRDTSTAGFEAGIRRRGR